LLCGQKVTKVNPSAQAGLSVSSVSLNNFQESIGAKSSFRHAGHPLLSNQGGFLDQLRTEPASFECRRDHPERQSGRLIIKNGGGAVKKCSLFAKHRVVARRHGV
jgi:hypothetical protein